MKIAFCTVIRLLKLHYLTSFVWPNSCFTNIKTFSVMGLPTHATHIRDRKILQGRCKHHTTWNDWYLVSTILENSRQFLYSSYQLFDYKYQILLEYYHYENSCLTNHGIENIFCFYRKWLYVSKTLIRNKSIVLQVCYNSSRKICEHVCCNIKRSWENLRGLYFLF